MAELDDDNSSQTRNASLYVCFLCTLFILIILLSKKLHESPRWNAVFSEAALVLVMGVLAGALVYVFGSEAFADSVLNFDPHVFFYALLPPILFTSGFALRRELFYRHLSPIVLFAGVGTVVSALATAGVLVALDTYFGFGFTILELFTFGALISATDAVSVLGVFQKQKVDPHLFSLVFGESALNDAVALVLFHVFAHFTTTQYTDSGSVWQRCVLFALEFVLTAVFSPLLGIALGVATALLFKFCDLQEHPKFELAIYAMLMYIPFLIAEELQLSGIVAIFFTGMSACRYVSPNVSETTQRNADSVFHLTAYVAETAIFLELGLSLFGLRGSFQWTFIVLAFVASLFGRAVSVYPLAYFSNWSLRKAVVDGRDETLLTDDATSQSSNRSRRRTPAKRKDQKISVAMAHMVWFSGLRGAVAYACAREFPDINGHQDQITAATMSIVLFTIVVMGGMTEFLLHVLQIDVNVDEERYMENWHKERELKGIFHTFEEQYIYRKSIRKDRQKTPDAPIAKKEAPMSVPFEVSCTSSEVDEASQPVV